MLLNHSNDSCTDSRSGIFGVMIELQLEIYFENKNEQMEFAASLRHFFTVCIQIDFDFL